MTPRRVTVLGSTGSVGAATLDLIARSRVEVEVVALVAGRNVEIVAQRLGRQTARHPFAGGGPGLEGITPGVTVRSDRLTRPSLA